MTGMYVVAESYAQMACRPASSTALKCSPLPMVMLKQKPWFHSTLSTTRYDPTYLREARCVSQ